MNRAEDAADEEEWRPISGAPLYEVSDQGRVRSWVDWPGRTSPLPRVLRGQFKRGRRVVQLGREGGLHAVDDLMHQIWNTSQVVPFRRIPFRWRRVMLTDKQHRLLIRVLELVDSPVARKLLTPIRTAKLTSFDDPYDLSEFALEEDR